MNTAYNSKENGDVLMTGVSKSALRWLAASLSLILFAAIVGLSYSVGVGDAEKGAIPIIRADGRSVKVRPENPGGRQYPHQDLVIYNSFRSDIAEKDTYLKDTPEKPLLLSEDNTLTNENTVSKSEEFEEDNLKMVTVSEEASPSTTSPLSEFTTKPLEQDQDDVKEIITQSSPPKEIKKVKITPEQIISPSKLDIQKPQKTTQPKPVSGSYLQIGAFRSKEDAETAFKRAKGKFSVLSSSNHYIAKANLGSKGIYYRLRVGPFANKKTALNTCNTLKTQGQACMHVTQ